MECPIECWTLEDQEKFLEAWQRIKEKGRGFEETAHLSPGQLRQRLGHLWRNDIVEGFLVSKDPSAVSVLITKMSLHGFQALHFKEAFSGIFEGLKVQHQFQLTWDEMGKACTWAASQYPDD